MLLAITMVHHGLTGLDNGSRRTPFVFDSRAIAAACVSTHEALGSIAKCRPPVFWKHS